MERHKDVIADALLAETSLKQIYERSDAAVRKLEGLEEVTGWLRGGPGMEKGEHDCVKTIREYDMRLVVDVAKGHKTGYYLDQRENRRLFRDWVQRYGVSFLLLMDCFICSSFRFFWTKRKGWLTSTEGSSARGC